MTPEASTPALLDAVCRAVSLCEAVRREADAPHALAKADRSPVTIADFGVQALLCRAVREAFPRDAIVAEEQSDLLRQPVNSAMLEAVTRHVGAALDEPSVTGEMVCDWIDLAGQPTGRFWTLDPIDGTKGYLRGDQYAIALALIAEGAPQVALLACPRLLHLTSRGIILVAQRGAGCVGYSLKGARLGAVRVSSMSDPTQARFAESVDSDHSDHGVTAVLRQRLSNESAPRRMDSQAKYAAVALGEAEAYLRIPAPRTPDYREAIWDHAAGALIVQEAGGIVTDLDGQALDWRQGNRLLANRGIVATNAAVYDAILDALRGT